MREDLDFDEKQFVEQYLMMMRSLLEIGDRYLNGSIEDVDMELAEEILRDYNELFEKLQRLKDYMI